MLFGLFGGKKKNEQQAAQDKANQTYDFSQLKSNDLWDRSRAQEDTANAGMQSGLQDYTSMAKAFTDPARFNRNQDAVDAALNQYGTRVSGMYDNPGYTSGEQAGMRYSATAPIAASYAGAQGDIRRHAAVTNNPAAYAGDMGQMARMRGQDLATAGAGVTKSFADARRGDQQAAINASQFPIAQRQQLIEGDRSMLPAFQFPAALNADVLKSSMATQTADRGVDASMAGQLQQLAYNPSQPGMWGQIFKNMMSKITGSSAGGGSIGLAQ